MNVDQYILEIDRFIELAENIIDDNPAALEKKIELLVKAHVLLGEVSGELYSRHKLLHVKRKNDHWNAYENAVGNKKMFADRAVEKIETQEAKYAGLARKYQNRFQSIEEEIHALKQKQRVNLTTGTIGSYGGG
jgi:predicted unusual protein kinase regulating ubiquinone biosynthesis (AarF/ABC1/UbiB family)